MKYTENSRVFASFSGSCPYKCLHCYTFSEDFVSKGKDDINSIISELSTKGKFNIVYISGYRENFIIPSDGLSLMEAIYDNFHCDILVTTRAVFDANNIQRLFALNKRMQSKGNQLYFCVSIPAYESYQLLEPNPIIPPPQERLRFLKQIYVGGINTLLTIRPLCPTEFIPVLESIKLLNEASGYCSAIISSGIVVDNLILSKLKGFPKQFRYETKKLMNCLKNDIDMKYVNVENELEQIEVVCRNLNIPFFKSSLPAINYLANLPSKNKSFYL